MSLVVEPYGNLPAILVEMMVEFHISPEAISVRQGRVAPVLQEILPVSGRKHVAHAEPVISGI